MELPLSELIVDPVVQRNLDSARVNELVRTWMLEYIGVWHISLREDGTKHTIDGQHRSEAMRILGYPGDYLVPCRVYTGLTLAEEARLFRFLNKGRAVHMLDQFRVRVVGEDLPAVELDAMLARHGWRVDRNGNDGSFRSVAALERVYQRFGLDTTEAVVRVITAAWGRRVTGVNGSIVSGLGHFLGRYGMQPELREEKVIRELSNIPPERFLSDARQHQSFNRGTIIDSVAAVLVKLHNRSRRTRLLPDWEATANYEQRVRRARLRLEAATAAAAATAAEIDESE